LKSIKKSLWFLVYLLQTKLSALSSNKCSIKCTQLALWKTTSS